MPFLDELSRRTIAVIPQNLVIGGIFRVAGLSLAEACCVSPVMVADRRIASGLIVILNSAPLVRSGEKSEQAEADRLAVLERWGKGRVGAAIA